MEGLQVSTSLVPVTLSRTLALHLDVWLWRDLDKCHWTPQAQRPCLQKSRMKSDPHPEFLFAWRRRPQTLV